MDIKTFKILSDIKKCCEGENDCTNCDYFIFNRVLCDESCMFTMHRDGAVPMEWDLDRFYECKNCAEYHNGRCLHYKHEVDTNDSCSFFYFKKG